MKRRDGRGSVLRFLTTGAGEMAEWLKAHAWKACIRETVSWVRIPLSPPSFYPHKHWLLLKIACARARKRVSFWHGTQDTQTGSIGLCTAPGDVPPCR